MPIHDWTRVEAGLFHAFHVKWISNLADALNEGALPPDYFAIPEQKSAGYAPDVLTLHLADGDKPAPTTGGLAVAQRPPQTSIVSCVEEDPVSYTHLTLPTSDLV